jgi:hypothetical protein
MAKHYMMFRPDMVEALIAGRKTQTRRPKGKYAVGDRILVKEDYFAWGHWDRVPDASGKLEWRFVDRSDEVGGYQYLSDPPAEVQAIPTWRLPPTITKLMDGWYKRTPMFMPAQAIRLEYEVVECRVGLVADISNEDAIAEGLDSVQTGQGVLWVGGSRLSLHKTPLEAFRHLWETIYPDSNDWESGQRVSAITLKPIRTPQPQTTVPQLQESFR